MFVFGATAQAQTLDEVLGPGAWAACKKAKVDAHAIKPDSSAATAALGKAGAAVASVPEEYRAGFQARFDMLKRGLNDASTKHAKGEGHRASGDGAYRVIAARVAAGNWLGVADAADACAISYYRAIGYLTQAEHGYGQVKEGSDNLVREITQFLAMLDAFEDFYGPIP